MDKTIEDQQIIDTAIARYRKKYPRLRFPQPSRHKSIIEGEVISLRNRTGELAKYKCRV